MTRTTMTLALAATMLLTLGAQAHAEKRATFKPQTVRSLEQRVQQITARIERSRQRMRQVKHKLLDGWTPDTVLELIHGNQLGRLFVIEKLRYTLDGRTLPVGKANAAGYARVFFGKVKPGKHRLKVTLVVRGNSRVLSYVSGLRVAQSRSFVFDVQPSTRQVITAQLKEASGLTPRLGRRFEIRINSEIKPSSVLPSK
jgi:hypothetical protein